MKYKTYDLIGVELEGGFKKKPPTRVKTDVSVRGVTGRYHGEVCSPPMKLRKVIKWMKANYPTSVNDSCGFHIHISMNLIDYHRCMSKEFCDYIIEKLKVWGKENNITLPEFWERLDGKNGFCIDEFEPDKQILGEPIQTNKTHFKGNRYTQINFSCFREHKTFELRVLPMFSDVETSISALKAYVDAVKNYLKGCTTIQTTKRKIEIEYGDEVEQELSYSI